MPAHRYTPGRKLGLYFLNRDAVLVIIKPGQALPYRRYKLEFLRNILKRRIIRHSAEHVLHDLFVRNVQLHKEKSAPAIFIFQVAQAYNVSRASF